MGRAKRGSGWDFWLLRTQTGGKVQLCLKKKKKRNEPGGLQNISRFGRVLGLLCRLKRPLGTCHLITIGERDLCSEGSKKRDEEKRKKGRAARPALKNLGVVVGLGWGIT